jgi:quinoprotein dehydrogenase-associated probable ABC transporter substrate-binding protein
MRRTPLLLVLTIAAAAASRGSWPVHDAADDLRICADPNNLPFSNAAGEGFENQLARLVADELGKKLSYTWRAQRRGFIRNTLKAGLCDVVMGVPTGYDPVETTAPYYRSRYVLVSRRDRGIDVASLKDARLREYRIGVHLIGDDGMNTPPAHALAQEGVVENVVGFTIYGDYREPAPPLRLIKAVENGAIDIAAAWGPFAGYDALHSRIPLRIEAIKETADFAPLRFSFDISMGVRKGDQELRRRLDEIISRKSAEIRAIVESYGVPIDRARNG